MNATTITAEAPMRNAMRISLVVMLFALAIWSVASVKADAGANAMHGIGATIPAILVQVDRGDVTFTADWTDGDARCTPGPGALIAFDFDDLSSATNALHPASDPAGADRAAAPFFLQRL
jgi:hypothetical protein